MRNKEIKSFEDNEIRLKEKQRKLHTLKAKMAELAKLVGFDKEERQQPVKNKSAKEEESDGEYEGVIQNGKKVYKAKNSENER